MDIIRKKSVQIGVIGMLVCIVYFNSLFNNFVSDDNYALLNNPIIFQWGNVIQSPFHFVQPLIYFLIAHLFGVTPWAFRLVSILAHLGSSILILLIVRRLYNPFTAFATATIFAIHPVAVESVAWVSGGPYSWYTFFFLLSLYLYIYSYSKKRKATYFSSIAAFFLSLEVSVSATPLFLLFLVYEYYFGNIKKNWKRSIPFFIPAVIFGIVAVSGINSRLDSYHSLFNQKFSYYNPFLIIPVAITTYIKLFLFPIGLSLYHSDLNFTQTQFNLMVIVTLLVLATWIYSAVKNKKVFFGLSLFFISLIPTLMPFAIHSGVAERYVNCGLIGLSLVVAFIIDQIPAKVTEFKYIILIALVLTLSVATIRRNADWKNERSLWEATIKVVPRDPIIHYYLAHVYLTDHEVPKAEQEFLETVRLNPYYKEAYFFLGTIYQKQNKHPDAVKMYSTAIQLDPAYTEAKEKLLEISSK